MTIEETIERLYSGHDISDIIIDRKNDLYTFVLDEILFSGKISSAYNNKLSSEFLNFKKYQEDILFCKEKYFNRFSYPNFKDIDKPYLIKEPIKIYDNYLFVDFYQSIYLHKKGIPNLIKELYKEKTLNLKKEISSIKKLKTLQLSFLMKRGIIPKEMANRELISLNKTRSMLNIFNDVYKDFDVTDFKYLHGSKYQFKYDGEIFYGRIQSLKMGKISLPFSEYVNFKNRIKLAIEEYPEHDVLELNKKELSVLFECKNHGVFLKTSRDLIQYRGCPKCAINRRIEASIENQTIPYSIFLGRFYSLHDKLTIISDESSYVNLNSDIIIKCNKHNIEFKKKAYQSLNAGCPECGKEKLGVHFKIGKENLLIRLNKIFPEYKFDTDFEYINYDQELGFYCNNHGRQVKKIKYLLLGYGCKSCKNNRYESEISDFLNSLNVIFNTRIRPIWMDGLELDFYIPEYNLAIEFNGLSFHHSSKNLDDDFLNMHYKSQDYHFNKVKLCKQNNVTLISIPDFYWIIPNKKEIIKDKIRHYLQMDNKIPARKCIIKEIDNIESDLFFEENHIEGSGFKYKNQKVIGLFYDNVLVMCCSYGDFYNQSSKEFETKINRICTKRRFTIVGGISKLLSKISKPFKIQISLNYGASLIDIFDIKNVSMRYFWISKNLKEFYHRNYCQKSLLEKHFGEPLLENETEDSYMQRLGFLKYYDCGVATLDFKV